MNSALRKRLFLVALVIVLAWLGTSGAILWDGLHDHIHHADVAVVFASKVERDGTLSARLRSRLNKALQLYREGCFPFVFVSGAVGKYGDDEAGAMQTYLVDHGVPATAIYADKTARNSYLTAKHASVYMRAHGMRSAFVVTQYFHVSRCKLALSQFDVKPVYAAHADIIEWRDPYFLLREAVGYWFYWVRGVFR